MAAGAADAAADAPAARRHRRRRRRPPTRPRPTRRRRRRLRHAPAGSGAQAQGTEPEAREGSTSPRTRRKDPGSDLILRNLVTGQEVTIPLVTDFEWNRDGSWIAYGVSSPKAEEDGAFARQMSDGSVRTLLKGKGNYKAFGFDEDGRQLAFLSDQAEYDKDVAPYRLYYWKSVRRRRGRARRRDDARHAAGHGGERPGRRSSFSKDGQRLYLGTAPPPAPPAAGRRAGAARRGPLALEGSAAPADAARARAAGAQPHLSRRRASRRQAVRAARHAGDADPDPRRRSHRVRSAPTTCPTGRKCPGTPTTATSTWSIRRPAQRKKINEHFRSGAPMTLVARRQVPALFR